MKNIRLFWGLCCLIFLAMAGFAFAELEDGLISAWTFDDGTAKDDVGENDGEIHGGVKVVDGKFGKAMSFNGVDGYIDVPHEESMEAMADAFTVSAWVYVRESKYCAAVSVKGTGIGWGIPYTYRIATISDTSLAWAVCTPELEGWFNTEDVITTNKWYFVCLTADGEQAVGYVNGKIVGEKAVAAPYLIDDSPIAFGVGRSVQGQAGNDAFLNAIIDEAYLWERGLSEDEVAQLAKGVSIRSVEPNGRLATSWGAIKE